MEKKYEIEVKKDVTDIIPSIKKYSKVFSKNAKKMIDEAATEGKSIYDNRKQYLKYELETKTLRPVFVNHLMSNEFDWPSIIHIDQKDDKHKQSIACDHASGHIDIVKGNKVLVAYRDLLPDFSIHFVPDDTKEYYYKHPFKYRTYVSLEDLFDVFYEERIDELITIASSLNCKYASITYKQESKSFISSIQQTYSYEEVVCEMNFESSQEVEAVKLEYFEDNEQLQTLIGKVLDQQLESDTYTIVLPVNSKGLTLESAAKLDSLLKKMNLQGNTLFQSEVNKDDRCIFEVKFIF